MIKLLALGLGLVVGGGVAMGAGTKVSEYKLVTALRTNDYFMVAQPDLGTNARLTAASFRLPSGLAVGGTASVTNGLHVGPGVLASGKVFQVHGTNGLDALSVTQEGGVGGVNVGANLFVGGLVESFYGFYLTGTEQTSPQDNEYVTKKWVSDNASGGVSAYSATMLTNVGAICDCNGGLTNDWLIMVTNDVTLTITNLYWPQVARFTFWNDSTVLYTVTLATNTVFGSDVTAWTLTTNRSRGIVQGMSNGVIDAVSWARGGSGSLGW